MAPRVMSADVTTAAFESAAMDGVVDYLGRGRQLAVLSDDELMEAWATAFRNVCNGSVARFRDFVLDAFYELALRGIEPDLDLVPEWRAWAGSFDLHGPAVTMAISEAFDRLNDARLD
jgi:hypothetical protein